MANEPSAVVTNAPAPIERTPSPSAWATPSPALAACPVLDRSVSTASSVSSISGISTSSRLSESGTGRNRRAGYMRPQTTAFSDSARNRESVMALGTIAHLQYYFARTGLLDGKGAQLARDRKKAHSTGTDGSEPGSRSVSEGSSDAALAYLNGDRDAASFVMDDSQSSVGLVESPIEHDEEGNPWSEPLMLPPTVSTYKTRTAYVLPPPDMMVLRRELAEALDDARKVLNEVEVRPGGDSELTSPTTPTSSSPRADANANQESLSQPTGGWHEIQGLHLLDIVTLAIRAAKNYYTAHERPRRLYAIRPERQIRGELYQVLEVLKRMASRNFAGGVRISERDQILQWTSAIHDVLAAEEAKEKAEHEERERWQWQDDIDASGNSWTGRERERENLFLRSFDEVTSDDALPQGQKLGSTTTLPPWTDTNDNPDLPTPFLQELSSGIRLVRLHNALVHSSARNFEDIKVFHTDTTKPYRRAENLRYWAKAAELRWGAKLRFDVMAVAQQTQDAELWRQFDQAVLQWATVVRTEITAEWKEMKEARNSKPPTLIIDTRHSEPSPVSRNVS